MTIPSRIWIVWNETAGYACAVCRTNREAVSYRNARRRDYKQMRFSVTGPYLPRLKSGRPRSEKGKR